jgi:hypothetical protein
VLFFFAIIFSSASSIIFLFCSVFHLHISIFFKLSTLYNAATSMMNSSCISFVFILQISHCFVSLFLVFSYLLIFNQILALTKKCSDCISAPLILLTSQTFIHCLCQPIWLGIFLPGDLVNVHMLTPCSRYI